MNIWGEPVESSTVAGTSTFPLNSEGDPTLTRLVLTDPIIDTLQAATKEYVDNNGGNPLPQPLDVTDTPTFARITFTTPVSAVDPDGTAATKKYVDDNTGDPLPQPLDVTDNPTFNKLTLTTQTLVTDPDGQVATRKYVDDQDATVLPQALDVTDNPTFNTITLTQQVTAATSGTSASSKEYVDTAISDNTDPILNSLTIRQVNTNPTSLTWDYTRVAYDPDNVDVVDASTVLFPLSSNTRAIITNESFQPSGMQIGGYVQWDILISAANTAGAKLIGLVFPNNDTKYETGAVGVQVGDFYATQAGSYVEDGTQVGGQGVGFNQTSLLMRCKVQRTGAALWNLYFNMDLSSPYTTPDTNFLLAGNTNNWTFGPEYEFARFHPAVADWSGGNNTMQGYIHNLVVFNYQDPPTDYVQTVENNELNVKDVAGNPIVLYSGLATKVKSALSVDGAVCAFAGILPQPTCAMTTLYYGWGAVGWQEGVDASAWTSMLSHGKSQGSLVIPGSLVKIGSIIDIHLSGVITADKNDGAFRLRWSPVGGGSGTIATIGHPLSDPPLNPPSVVTELGDKSDPGLFEINLKIAVDDILGTGDSTVYVYGSYMCVDLVGNAKHLPFTSHGNNLSTISAVTGPNLKNDSELNLDFYGVTAGISTLKIENVFTIVELSLF